MESYIESSERRYGKTAKERLSRIFHAFDLPEPGAGEFIEGAEANLLFLDRYGLVLRTGEKMYVPENDLILQPLSATSAFHNGDTDCTIELLPGVDAVAKTRAESEMLALLLEEEGVDFHDCLRHNTGRIPVQTPDFPEGVPVVIDRGAVSVLNGFFRDGPRIFGRPDIYGLRESFNRQALCGFQDVFYAPLHQTLRAAWPEGCAPDHAKLADFLSLCAAEINKARQGQPALLSNNWRKNDGGSNPEKAVQAAILYGQRL